MITRFSRNSVLDELDQLQREMNRLFEGYTGSGRVSAPAFPPLNVYTNADEMLLTAELPGVNLSEMTLTVKDRTLTLEGTREADDLPEDAITHRRERASGAFTRTVALPFDVEADKVEASLVDGILQVHLPRAEATKPRKIEIKTK